MRESIKIVRGYNDTECNYCGWPFYPGDTAVWIEEDIAGLFCCDSCADKAVDDNARRVSARLRRHHLGLPG
jgi:ribosomal protein L24E